MIRIKFKDIDVFKESLTTAWHPILIDLVEWLMGFAEPIVVTSAKRKGDSGVHGTTPLRGFDLRSWAISDPLHMRNETNRHWKYDHKRPEMEVCKYHKTTNDAMHLHFQVHPNTRFINNG